MPTEIRKIIFDKHDVQNAVVGHCLHANITLPQAAIEGIVIGMEHDSAVTLNFTRDDPAIPNDVTLSREEVGAALIRYCRDNKIPLPRRAPKILQPGEDSLSLFVKMDLS